MLADARRLLDAARSGRMPVVHCAYVVDTGMLDPIRLHPLTTDGRSAFSDKSDPHTAICPEVEPLANEVSLVESEASAPGDSSLERRLREQGIQLTVAGVWTGACVDASIKQAVAPGFRVLLVKDACGTWRTVSMAAPWWMYMRRAGC